MPNYYDLLGLSRSAPTSAVREAYARQARERHPDRFSDPQAKKQAEDAFKEITAAFNTLSSERLRQEYDAELARPRPTTPEEVAAEAYAMGLQRFEARDYAEAATCLRVAAHNAPNEARYQLALGRALARSPRSAREAVEALEAAARLAPNDPAAHVDLARIFLEQGLKTRAQRAVETALRLAPQDAQVRRLASEIRDRG
jgi:curved DNA-binding protein CbpA